MAIGLSQFINTPPTAENIQALVSSSMVIGLTVSTTDCNLNNFQRSLSQLNTISIDGLNNDQPISITSKQAKNSYYYLEVEPFSITGELTGDSCLQTTLNPFIEAVGFENSDFNILFNNTTASRKSTYIQDVDRVRGSVTASNMPNILNDTAIRASIPDSYYTSLAHTSGRYIGSKTSEETYGVSPALGVNFFEGSEHLISVNTGSICGEAISDRNLETFVYTGNFDFPVSGSRIFKTEGNRALPVRNRQIWVRSNTTIYTTDSEGYVNNSGTQCST